MLPEIQIICVGKYKDKNLEALEAHYLKQIKKVSIKEIKTFAEDILKEEQELTNILSQYQKQQVFLLTEKGKEFNDSIDFSKFIEAQSQRLNKSLVFVISGAVGFTKKMKSEYQCFSLSPLTLPHKLCRLILVEQIYRAHTILTGHPYHN